MAKERGEKRMWVKEDIKAVLTQWNTKTTAELAEQLGCSSAQVTYIATQARKLGYSLPRKHKNGVVQGLLKEVIAEIK